MAGTCPSCTDDRLCPECAADFELLKRHPDPVQRLADLAWLRDFYAQQTRIDDDLMPTIEQLDERMQAYGREAVVTHMVYLMDVCDGRRMYRERTGGAA